MSTHDPEVIFRPGRPVEEGGHPGRGYRHTVESGLIIEHDIGLKLRDDVTIYADLYRPEHAEQALPTLIAWGPYGKHNGTARYDRYPNRADVNDEWLSPYAIFEGPDPAYWCSHGYAVLVVDNRGSWASEGNLHIGGRIEGEDAYEVVEWAGTQSWSNGKVGMTGVSYLAIIQWLAGPLRPPHLTALNPWEGFNDPYREAYAHGGIPETTWVPGWNHGLFSRRLVEDTATMMAEYPLMNAYWESKVAPVEDIDIPTYVVASWSDQGLHTRGTIEAFKNIGATQKWLDVHGRKKWEHYHEPQNVDYVRGFFDRFLKGRENGWDKRPAVRVEVRDRGHVGRYRGGDAWPLPETRYDPLYLDSQNQSLSAVQPSAEGEARYAAEDPSGRASFRIRFDQDTELTGNMKLRLWVYTDDGDDMDLFVAVEKYDEAGVYMGFPFSSAWEDGPVALGWLRASHRELDAERSTPQQPWLLHRRELALPTGEAAPVEIEIWPSSTVFRPGEQLQLVVAGADIHNPLQGHKELRNKGTHVVKTGGQYDSHLLIPVIAS